MSGGQPTAAHGSYTPPGGKGDPILTGFDLRSFEFMGEAGSFYNLVSEMHHQVDAFSISSAAIALSGMYAILLKLYRRTPHLAASR